jgi:hypothetical protein
MRLEVDRELGKILDEIKKHEPSVYGRGHVETVRFLAKYYKQHKPLQQLVEDLDVNLTHFLENLNPNIEKSLHEVFRKALADVIGNVLIGREEYAKPPGRGLDPAARRSLKRRSSDETQLLEAPGPGEEETFK